MNSFSSSLILVVPKFAVPWDDLEIGKLKPKPGTEACLLLPVVTRDGTWGGTWHLVSFKAPQVTNVKPLAQFQNSRPEAGDCGSQTGWGLGGRSSWQREAKGAPWPCARCYVRQEQKQVILYSIYKDTCIKLRIKWQRFHASLSFEDTYPASCLTKLLLTGLCSWKLEQHQFGPDSCYCLHFTFV